MADTTDDEAGAEHPDGPPADFRERFETWWAELEAEGQERKNPYHVDGEILTRLAALPADAPERRWIHAILVDGLASPEVARWHAAMSLICQARVPAGPAALRATAASADSESKRDCVDTFLHLADSLEQELTVPESYRSGFDAWWDERIARTPDTTLLQVAEQGLAARVDALAPEAAERAWVAQLMIERVGDLDLRRSRPALAFLRKHLVAGAIPEIRHEVGWNRTDEMQAVAVDFLTAADDIAEAAGWPVEYAASHAFDRPKLSYEPDHRVVGAGSLADLSVWAPRRRRPVSGPLDFTTRRHIERRHDLLAAEGRRTGDPGPAGRAVARWIAEGDRAEQEWVFQILTDWLASRDPWRWQVALDLLGQHLVRPAVPAIRAAVGPPNTSEKARWAPAFEQAARRIEMGGPHP